jgi:two-component sensor histidine kinase/DNA-binding response OmpR family regulator
MDKVNILLVDDQPAKLLSYEVILGELGENLIKASSPDEALGILLRNDVALVLIDVVMPQIDGFQLAAMIREHPRFQKLAIIFVSGVQIADTDHMRGYEIGAVDYVAVPVVPEVLRAKVKVFVELYRKTRQLEELNAELEQRVANRTGELAAQTERLRLSEEQRSLALSAIDMGSWQYDVTSGNLDWDEGLYRIYRVDPLSFTPTMNNVLALVDPKDVEKYPLVGALKQDGRRYQAEFRIRGSDSEVRWFFGSAAITRDAEGRPIRLSGVSVDITERKRAEDRQLLLAREVDHRAKNTLAVVLSVLRLTKARTTPEFVKIVEGRIHALAATHNLLSQTRWVGADLRRIVEEELAAYRTDHRERVVTAGPSAMLLPATAQALALALHELATNAAKYGALSVEDGQLQLKWAIGQDGLVLDWVETGGPLVAPPQSLGFGLTIVRSSIEAQFHGGVDFDWTPGGLRCRLSIPSAQIVAAGPVEKPPAVIRSTASQRTPSLRGRRLLMVEDEFLIGMMIKRLLEGFGATVLGPCGRLAEAMALAKSERFDGALVDLNLAGKPAEPLADLLVARGVPFAFVTGYQRDSIDRRYANIPVLQKPIEADLLERTLVSLLDPPRPLRVVEAD